MVNFAMGSLLALVALAMLVAEWRRLRAWRRRPDETIYSQRVFLRRGLVSVLMLSFIALYRFQPLVLAGADSRRAALFLSLYFVLVLAIFILAAFDFAHHRRLAARLEFQLAAIQQETFRLMAESKSLEASEESDGAEDAVASQAAQR